MNVYAKFRCAALRIRKALGIFKELIPTRTTTRVAFLDTPSRSKTEYALTAGKYIIMLHTASHTS